MDISDETHAERRSGTTSEVTLYLQRVGDGDSSAVDQLLPHIYDELHSLARRAMRGRRRDQTLQPTALVHEAYLRLFGPQASDWENRRHFFAVATMAMRQLLTDYARAKDAQKRVAISNGSSSTRASSKAAPAATSTWRPSTGP